MGALLDLIGGGPTTTTPSGGGPAPALGSSAPPAAPFYAGAAVPAPAAHHGGEGLGGLFSEAAHLVPNAVLGLGNLAVSAAGDVPRVFKAEKQQVGRHGLVGLLGLLNPKIDYQITRASHVIHGFEDSFGRTVGDVAHPSHFVQAYNEHHLLGKVVEDVANASVVGDAVGAPLAKTEAAAEEAAKAAETAHEAAVKDVATKTEAEQTAHAEHPGGIAPAADARIMQASADRIAAESRAAQLSNVADTLRARADRISSFNEHVQNVQKLASKGSNPIEAAGHFARGIIGGGELPLGVGHFPGVVPAVAGIDEGGVLGRALSHVPGARAAPGGAQRLVEVAAKHGEAKTVKAALRQEQFNQARTFAPTINAGIDRAKLGKGLGKTQARAEEAAATLANIDKSAENTSRVSQYLTAAGRPDLAEQVVAEHAPTLGVKPEALSLAVRSLDPTLTSPELEASRGRMAQSADIYEQRQQLPAQEAFTTLRGEGVTGDARVALAEWRRQSLGTEPVAGNPDAPAERELIANAPVRFRKLLNDGVAIGHTLDTMAQDFTRNGDHASADLLTAAKAEAITTLDQAVHEHVNPLYVQGGELPEHGPSGRATTRLPKQGKTGSREFGSGEHQPTSTVDQTRLILNRWRDITNNESAQRLQRSLGVTPVQTEGDAGRAMSARELAAWAKREDLTAWDPSSPFSGKVADKNLTPDTAFLPSHIYRTYQQTFKTFNVENLPTVPRLLLKGYDKATRGAIAGFLYYSPRWVTGHTISHAIISSFGAGIAPNDLVHAWRQAYHVVRGEEIPGGASPQVQSLLSEGKYGPGELIGRGFPGVDATMQERLTPGHSILGKPSQWSKGAVAFTDDMNRVAIAIAKAEKGWKNAAERDAFRAAHPELAGASDEQLLNEYAIRESLKAQGDFTNLTGAEREFVGRLVLFYPWIKHITTLAAGLAVHHPLRVAWALHLADLYGPNSQTSLTEGKIPLGNQWFESIPKINPFGDIFSNLGATGSGTSPLGALNPVLTTALGVGLGANAAKLQLISRPPGYGNTDQFGKTSWGPLGEGTNTPAPAWLRHITPGFLHGAEARLQPILDYVSRESPQITAGAQTIPALFGHAPIARYQTGEGIHVGHQDIAGDQARLAPFAGGGSLSALLSLLGIPNATKIDEKAVIARAAARIKQLEGARASYQQLLPGRAP